MGQYWRVASLDGQQDLSPSGKLGEILPGGYAGRHLQQRLMVPLYKQYVKPTTLGVTTNHDIGSV